MRLPNFLIIGVPKAGTTSIYHWLSQHPEVYMSPIKEPHYFSQINNENHIIDWNKYIALFSGAQKEHKAIGEASTSYFYFYKTSIPLIKKRLGNPKIIVILRNPVERAWSHFMYYKKLNREKFDPSIVFDKNYLCFSEPWGKLNPYLAYSFYSKPLKEFLRNFHQVKVLLYDDLKKKSEIFIRNIYRFLEIDDSFIPKFEVRNISGKPRNQLIAWLISNSISEKMIPRIPYFLKAPFRLLLLKKEDPPNDIRKKLIYIFKNDVENLENILGISLKHWLEVDYQ